MLGHRHDEFQRRLSVRTQGSYASSISAALAVTVEQIPYPASSSVCIEAGLLLQAETLACSCRHMQSSSQASTLGIAALVDLVGI
jgi:hypothetical protein